MQKKKFISIVWGYHKQIFNFDKKQNYHMLPIEIMREEGFECEIFSIDSQVKIEDDPNFIKGTKVLYYKGIISYLWYLFENRNVVMYSNSITIKTLLVGLIGKRTVFYPHSYPFGNSVLKKIIIIFFYYFFSKIRINNEAEFNEIEKIKKGLGYICPLSVSGNFLNTNLDTRKNGIWIGNLTSIKNPELLLKLGRELKKNNINFTVNIIGEDRYNRNGRRFCDLIIEEELGDYIRLLGVLDYKGVKKELSKTLICINTSISEGQCLAVYEAALAGNILCLQNIMSFPSVFHNNALYHDDSNELTNNIIFILSNKKKFLEKIKENQKMILREYNYEHIKKGLKKLFIN